MRKVKNELKYIKSQYNKKNCKIFAKLSPRSVKYLKIFTKPSPSLNKDGSMTQKEFSGALKIGNIIEQKGQIVFEMMSDKESIKEGIEEEVDAVWDRYNFHTHPKEAYVRNGVTNGWPSSQDFIGFFELNHYTIFHIVVTIEGIYVISFSPEWISSENKYKHKKVVKFIDKHYDIDHKKDITKKKYVDIINNIKYKKTPIFMINYFSWNNATNVFPVFYEKKGINCVATEELNNIIDNYLKV